jgi:hypothetical protein
MTSETNTGIWAFLAFIATFVAVEIFKKVLKKGFKRLFKKKEQPVPKLEGGPPEIQRETLFRIRRRSRKRGILG